MGTASRTFLVALLVAWVASPTWAAPGDSDETLELKQIGEILTVSGFVMAFSFGAIVGRLR